MRWTTSSSGVSSVTVRTSEVITSLTVRPVVCTYSVARRPEPIRNSIQLDRLAGGLNYRLSRSLGKASWPTRGLLNQLGAKTCEFYLGDRSRILQTVKSLNLIGNAEPRDTSQLVTSMPNTCWLVRSAT